MNKLTFTFYTDPSHGWLEVPFDVLAKVGVVEEITQFSYMDEVNAYLEEDCDASTFMEAFFRKYGKEAFGHTEQHSNRSSSIRRKPTYDSERVKFILKSRGVK